MPHPQQGAKIRGKKALQTGVSVAQDVLAGENLKTATNKRAKQALGLPSQNSPQAGAGKKKVQKGKHNSENAVRLQARNGKHLLRKRNPETNFPSGSKMAFVHQESQECTKSELDLFTIPATQTSTTKGQWIEYHPLNNITDTGPIEFNVSGTGEEYLELAKTQLFVKAKITKANGDNLESNTQGGPMNLSERVTDFPLDQYLPISCHD